MSPPTFRPARFGVSYARPEADRPSAARRGYGRPWRELRASFLAEHPRCADCAAPATEVDHIISLRRGGANDAANLRALCKPCHARKTAAVDGALGGKNLCKAESMDPAPHRPYTSAKSSIWRCRDDF